MIRRVLGIGGAIAGALLGVAFGAGALLGAVSRALAGAFFDGVRGSQRKAAADPRAITRRGIQAGVLLALIGLAIVGVVGGGLVFVSGIVSIKASSRHWPITERLLHTGMERSVATHSLGIDVPSLDDPDLALKGAGHYEIGCRPCHGSPGLPQPRIAYMMTPHPPYLPPRIGHWKRAELFYLVKHGVKFTGMPAWPALGRDDEIWAMVAFLERLPHLDEPGYRRLAYGEPHRPTPLEAMEGAEQIPSAALQSCARCHGYNGIGRGSGAFPNLAGQNAEYLKNSLQAYARGDRHSGIMQPIALGLTAEAIDDLSRYYSKLPPASASSAAANQQAAIDRGRSIAFNGVPSQRVPSCLECHAPEGRRHKPAYPELAGQPAGYLVLQLELFRKKQRGGSAYAHLMHAVAPRLQPGQMRDVAFYFQSLPSPNEQN